MSKLIDTLSKQFCDNNCYNTFGACLRKVKVKGFRGISDVEVNIDFPIIAFTGLNGAGKSTVGQLLACAYRNPSSSVEYKRLYVKDFFPISKVDPSPIASGAEVIYWYQTDDPQKRQTVTVSRVNSAWSGYKRQPERHCYYVGFTVYIPKIERRDPSVYGGAQIQLTQQRNIDENTVTRISKILDIYYSNVNFQGINHKGKKFELGMASRYGVSYSENNMGFGEGRLLYTIDKLENSPDSSLFILEEPETSLHESAQYNFAKYLLNVCSRKHHQIILSTHSSIIIEALPSISRKLIIRDDTGVCVKDSLSSMRIKNVLTGGFQKGLKICVEDDFAKFILTEVIRMFDSELLKSISIHPMGNITAVKNAVEYLNQVKIKAIGVRDGDTGECPKNHMFSLPGSQAPEKEVFSCEAVQVYFKEHYNINISEIMGEASFNKAKVNHHDLAELISNKLNFSDNSSVKVHAVEEYLKEKYNDFLDLLNIIKSHA